MLRSRRWSAFLIVPLLVFLMAGRQVPLVDPDPVAIPAGIKESAVKKSIRAALVARGWVVNEEKPGKITSTLNLRKHMAKVEIDYDTKQIRIKHIASTNLLEETKNGQVVIHKKYLEWVKNLSTDIQGNLALASD